MDIFKLGVRDILGIVLPGSVLLFAIIYMSSSVLTTLGLPSPLDVSLLKDQGFLLSIVLFVASYVLGYLLRLGTADKVDKASSECCLREWRKGKGNKAWTKWRWHAWIRCSLKEWRRRKENQAPEEDFKQWLDQMRRGEKDILNSSIPTEFDHWLWRAERFPYPVCRLRQERFKYPDKTKFFNQYKRRMGLVSDSTPIAGKQFFNYCKLVISKEDDVLREEINAAEGSTRFLVGTYCALRLSFWILFITLALQLIIATVLCIGEVSIPDLRRIHLASLLSSTLLLILGSYAARLHIKKHFRSLRLREVDIVYDAFYLVCKEKGHDAKSVNRLRDWIRRFFSHA